MNIEDFLQCEDVLDNMKIFQVISFGYFDEDLQFTQDHFRKIAAVVDPYMVSTVAQRLYYDPDLLNRCRTSNTFQFPTTIQELRSLMQRGQPRVPPPPSPEPTVSELFSDVPICAVRNVEVEPTVELAAPVTIAPPVQVENTCSEEGIDVKTCEVKSPDARKEPVLNLTDDKLSQFVYCDDLIYAPPYSGKTTFNAGNHWHDTDDIRNWKSLGQTRVITNRPELIMRARRSIAIIPTRSEFEKRCKLRGLVCGVDWYDDMLKHARKATHVIYSNGYLDDIFITSEVARRFLAS